MTLPAGSPFSLPLCAGKDPGILKIIRPILLPPSPPAIMASSHLRNGLRIVRQASGSVIMASGYLDIASRYMEIASGYLELYPVTSILHPLPRYRLRYMEMLPFMDIASCSSICPHIYGYPIRYIKKPSPLQAMASKDPQKVSV